MLFYLEVLFLINYIQCEWVEISQKIISEDVQSIQKSSTTPRTYEVFMKTPTSKKHNDIQITTPTYFSTSNIDRSDTIADLNIATTPAYAENTIFSKNFRRKAVVAKINLTTQSSIYTEEAEAEIEEVSYQGFLPFIKSVQKTLLKLKDPSVSSKINVLTNLRDNLLHNIKNRISTLWQPELFKTAARGYEDDDHMDFPSNEGALMTIGFLTFAVFLIKLVLKLIYALKYKQQYYQTTTVPTAAVYFGRRKRDLDEDEGTRILKLIDEFKFN